MKHIHILGICGTFMGGLAVLARQLGYRVTGSDKNVYPPMSTQLEEQGIELIQGYEPAQLEPAPDMVVVGNAMSRGNPCVEYVLDRNIPYTSGPQWLLEHLLKDRWVLAVSGTHGKTSTASMLAWIMEDAGLNPGYLIGGVPGNFEASARLGASPFFVIEADEYDSAFFDKRSKFVHYRPRTLIFNNLEFDHADIFTDLKAIQTQFHHLIRMLPSHGRILCGSDPAIAETLDMGCWSEIESVNPLDLESDWSAQKLRSDGSQFEVLYKGAAQGTVEWDCIGDHNVQNALMAIAAAQHSGVRIQDAIVAMQTFRNTKRRMELRGTVGQIHVYDDFAHHPTAITTTIAGLRSKVGAEPILAVLEPRSNTMTMGVHQDTLAGSLTEATSAWVMQPDQLEWDMHQAMEEASVPVSVMTGVDQIIDDISVAAQRYAHQPVHILIMSNGGFANIHQRLLERLGNQSG